MKIIVLTQVNGWLTNSKDRVFGPQKMEISILVIFLGDLNPAEENKYFAKVIDIMVTTQIISLKDMVNQTIYRHIYLGKWS